MMANSPEYNKSLLKSVGENVFVSANVEIRRPHLVSLGDNVDIDSWCYLTPGLEIGDYVHIAAYVAVIGWPNGFLKILPTSARARLFCRGLRCGKVRWLALGLLSQKTRSRGRSTLVTQRGRLKKGPKKKCWNTPRSLDIPTATKNKRFAMKIVFITSKLNFKTAGGSIEELDLLMQTLQNLGNDVKTVTAFSANNVIPEKRPYEVIEEQITSPRLLGIAWQLYKILKKYEKMADIFHIDGHIFLYGAGLYKLLGGRVSVAAYFNYYLMCWEDTAISLTPLPKENIFIRAKKKIRWLIEKYIGMPLANRIDLFAFVSPNLKAVYEDFGLRRDPGTFVIGDLIDFQKIMRENGIS